MQRSKNPSFDYLVGAQYEPCGNLKADRPRGLQIDDQLEVRRLLNWHICGLGSAQNFGRQPCPLPQELGKPRTIAKQPTLLHRLRPLINRGYSQCGCLLNDGLAVAMKKR